MSAVKGCVARSGVLTYCAISGLGLIPVMGGEVMESAEDVLVGDTCEAGWRVGPRDESGSGGGGRGGHDCLGGVSGDGEGPG
jgi:hypothetical protein